MVFARGTCQRRFSAEVTFLRIGEISGGECGLVNLYS
jgi:hypothetical protein